VTVGEIAAYPTGFSFVLRTIPRRYSPRGWQGLDAVGMAPPHTSAGELRPELLRYGVEFPDGARATSLDFARQVHSTEEPPPAPTLWPHGSTTGGGRVRQEAWIWPLPPPGRITFGFEWPAAGVELARADMDAQLIRDAAARARVLWPDDGR
jgi:hypothetical protein